MQIMQKSSLLLWLLLTGLCYACETTPAPKPLADVTTTPTPSNEAPTIQPRQTLERLSAPCTRFIDSSCTCDYRLKGETAQQAPFFTSDMGLGPTACVQIGNDLVTLQSREENVYFNEKYELIVDTKPVTHYEGEANTYEGDLILKDKKGTILHVQPVSGTCGC